MSNHASWAVSLKEVCEKEIETLETLYAERRAIPIYKLAYKRRIKKSILAANDVLKKSVCKFIESYKLNLQRDVQNLNLEFEKNTKELLILDTEVATLNSQITIIDSNRNTYSKVVSAFNDNDYPDLKLILSDQEYSTTESITRGYLNAYMRYRASKNKMDKLRDDIEKLKSNISEWENKCLSVAEKQCLNDCASYIENCLSYKSVYNNVFLKEMRMLYKKNKERYRGNNYRHKIYIKLIFCMLYFAKLMRVPNFINIDEAQDLSISEYKVLRAVLGENCTFNLYGDVKQLVYSYKGITDWKDIQDIIDNNIYFLNENYRNTVQITEYCNKEFGADVFPIGVLGKEVEKKSIEDAIKSILNKKIAEPYERNAIIFKHGISSIQRELERLLAHENASWYMVDDTKVSVITVEMSKGIEFDNVVVIADQMSPNERYISYTRALNELTIVYDSFEANTIEEYAETAIIDDTI